MAEITKTTATAVKKTTPKKSTSTTKKVADVVEKVATPKKVVAKKVLDVVAVVAEPIVETVVPVKKAIVKNVKKAEKQIKITLIKSTIGALIKQKRTIEALGLRKIRSSVVKNDNPVTRGMIHVVSHLVTVENV